MHSRSETVPLKPQFQSRNRISVQKPRVGATSPCHEPGTVIDRADLILEVGYFCADSGLFKKRVVVCEVDGDDKTKHSKTEYNEEKTQITRPENDPIKLALKLMSSTVAQNAIQSETYHIRANYAWYNTDAIQKSLLSTTTHDLPDFADLIETLNKDRRTDDFRTLHHSIHLRLSLNQLKKGPGKKLVRRN